MNQAHLDKVIQEVFTSEKSYYSSMEKCVDNILKELEQKIESKEVVIENPSFLDIFEKYKDILLVSSGLLKDMNKYLDQGQKISVLDVFANFGEEQVNKYFEYILAYHDLSENYRNERAANPKFNAYLNEKETLLKDTLPSYLILPIQRLPRYRLLIQEIIKYSDSNSPEYAGLQQIRESICKAISEIDQKMEADDNTKYNEFQEGKKFAELQSQIIDFEVSKLGRHLFFEGEGTKFSRKTEDIRHLFLFSDCLLIAENSLNPFRIYKVNKIYSSGDYNIVEPQNFYGQDFSTSVDVRQKIKSFRIKFRTTEEKKNLLIGFSKVLGIINKSPHEMEMKCFAPVWIPDSMAPKCMICGSKFTIFNRKHHCRYCGRCICRKCFQHTISLPGFGNEPQKVCIECFTHITQVKLEHPEMTSESFVNMCKETQAKSSILPNRKQTLSAPANGNNAKLDVPPTNPPAAQQASPLTTPPAKPQAAPLAAPLDTLPTNSYAALSASVPPPKANPPVNNFHDAHRNNPFD